MRFKIKGVNDISRKLEGLSIWSRSKYTQEMVDLGYKFAERIASKDKGALQKAIYKTKGQGSKKATLSLKTPNHPDGRKRKYHLWQHGLGKYDISTGKYRPKSGDPKFMFTTQEYMNREVGPLFDKRFKKSFK